MNESIFRKKSLEKIKEPDDLNDYVRVTNPSVWLLLLAIAALLIGLFVWGFFGRIESKISSSAVVTNQMVSIKPAPERLGDIEIGMPVRIGDKETVITGIDLKNGVVIAQIDLPNGSYDAEILLAVYQPISFVLN